MYPEITFTSSQVDATSGEITGMLDFHGVEHEVTFPATITDTTITADFVLDTTPFNIKYTGVNKEVRIAFEFSV